MVASCLLHRCALPPVCLQVELMTEEHEFMCAIVLSTCNFSSQGASPSERQPYITILQAQ